MGESPFVIDVHMIDSGRFPENAARQLERLRHQLVTAHVALPVWGNTLQARANGYAMGKHPYVAHIDDDDEVLDTEWLERAVQIMESRPEVSAVYPRYRLTLVETGQVAFESPAHEWEPSVSRRRHPPYVHNFTVMRRGNVQAFFEAAIENVGKLVSLSEVLLFEGLARHGRPVADPSIAYHWIVRRGSGNTSYVDEDKVRLGRWGQTYRAACEHALQGLERPDVLARQREDWARRLACREACE